MIGLKRGTVKLLKNNPEWAKIFETEKKKLKKVFNNEVVDIQHVGSTAIPSISAKPIIDIGIMVHSFNIIRDFIEPLGKIGYILKKEDRSDRLFFTKGLENKRTHYLHIGELGGGYIENMILFRDYLKKHKNVAKEYEILKKKLANLHSENRNLYTSEKEKFILHIIKKARNTI